jgi:CrcB protein
MKNIILVFLGAGFGGVLRYAIGNIIKWNGTNFPWATFVVNIIGSFLIGIILAYSLKNETFTTNYKLLLTTGICGGFTTFSALSAESLQLIKQGNWMLALAYIICSIVLGIVACGIGFQMIEK